MKKSNIIIKYINGDILNIEKVMEDFTPYIYTILINKNVKFNNEDIEEIISDVFLVVWQNRYKLDKDKEMSSYIAKVANNIYNKKIRNRKENSSIEILENKIYDADDIEVNLQNEEKNKIIITELNKMKPEDRIIFMSYYYYSKSMKKISEELDITENKIKSRLFRIRRKLKKILERKGYSYDE